MIAAKFGDPVAGIDCHMVMVPSPAGPVPTPLPHPFIGVVFDPLGAAIGAAMDAIFGGGGPVIVNLMPTGNTGTEVKNIPHIPTPPGVAPAPNDAPPGNEGTLITGSKTVDFAGSSQSRTLSVVMSCGFPINAPTSVCGAVPAGAPVLIGGPEAVDFAAAATQAIRTKWVSDKLHSVTKATKGSKRSKVICFLTGHPVDVMTGELLAEAVDASLPGTIPLRFERNYRSRDTESLLLGPGWYHFFDAYVERGPTATCVRLPDGRGAEHPLLGRGESYFHAPDRYTLYRDDEGYRLAFNNGITYFFSANDRRQGSVESRCRLTEIRDRARNAVSLTWQGSYLSRIVDTARREIACRYNREGKLERLIVMEGALEHQLIRYAYDTDGRLAAAFDPSGHAIRYSYRHGVMVREIHKNGLTFHFEWDWEHPEGWCTRTWGDAGENDPACMDLAPGGRPLRAIFDRRLTYDKHGHRTMVHDGRGGIAYYEGNALELVDKEIDPTGRVTKYEWNEHGWKTAEENGNGERYEWLYDARGNQVLETDPLGGQTCRAYDQLDRLQAITGPNGAVHQLEYDRSSQVAVVRQPDGTAVLYTNDEFGRLTRIDDAMGRATQFRWSPSHDLVEHIDPELRSTSFEHDDLGRLRGARDALGRHLLIARDENGEATFVRRFDGEELSFEYDVEGNVTSQTDSRGRTVRMRYAGLGQLVEHFDAMGNRIRLQYDEDTSLVGVENQAGDVHSFTRDRAGRVTAERTFTGTKRQYTHDRAGRPMQMLSGAYRLTRFERDRLGRVVKQTAQGGNPTVLARPTEELFAFDASGSLASARTPDSVVTFERDPVGRVVREASELRATGLTSAVSSRYDHSGNRVERSTTLAHRTSYAWNNADELIGVSASWNLGADSSALRRLGLRQAKAQPFELRIARDAVGQELARRLPGGVASLWERDDLGRARVQHVVAGATTQSRGRDVARRTYAWSAPEELASVTTLDGSTGTTRASAYEYDPRGHLIRQLFADGSVVERQSDAIGNLFRNSGKTDRVYGRGGTIRRAGGTDYELDPDGFLIKKTLSDGAVWRYNWNAHGELVEVHRPDGKAVAFTYDAFGRRIAKHFDGKTIEFVWDRDVLVHERVRDVDGRAQPVTTWVFEPGSFTPLAKLEGSKRYGVVSDHMGTPMLLTTELGKVAWSAQLDVYGVPRQEVTVAEEDRTSNPWRFCGQYADEETGLYYNRFRYYDPELGRYISEDPIGLDGGDTNPFTYPEDPWRLVDPLGLVKGGSYHQVRGSNKGGEVHHTPAQSTYTDLDSPTHSSGPSVHMSKKDHRKTGSHGSQGDAGKLFRKEQQKLVDAGKWSDAIAMDVKDVSKKFPGKYKKGLREMIDYAHSQDLITQAEKKKLKAMCK